MISDDPTIVEVASGYRPITSYHDTENGPVLPLGWFDQDDEDLGVGLSGSGSGEEGVDENPDGGEVINVTVNNNQDKGMEKKSYSQVYLDTINLFILLIC